MNLRRSIRNSNKPPSLQYRPKTPPLLKLLKKRALKVNTQNTYHSQQMQWFSFYNQLRDEYQRCEIEILNLTMQNILKNVNLSAVITNNNEQTLKYIRNFAQTHNINDNIQSSSSKIKKTMNAIAQTNIKLEKEKQKLENELKQFSQKYISQKIIEKSSDENVKQKKNIPYDGWTHFNHQLFENAFAQFNTSSNFDLQKFLKYMTCLSNNSNENITETEIRKHIKWHRLKQKELSNKKVSKISKRKVAKLLKQQKMSSIMIESSIQRIKLNENHSQEKFDQNTNSLHLQIKDINSLRRKQIIENRNKEDLENDMNRKLKEYEHEKWMEYRVQSKLELNNYYDVECSKLLALKMKSETERVLAKSENILVQKHNKKRVEYRVQKQIEKQNFRLEKIKLEESLVEEKNEILKKLRASVMIEMNLDEIIVDKQRMMQNTECRKKRKMDDVKNINHHNFSYTDDQLFADEKFCLLHSLVANDLHHNSYAQNCLKNINIFKERKDCKHTIDILSSQTSNMKT